MGQTLPTDSIGTPTRWLLVFNRKAETWWSNLIAFGKYKHVRAFGYVADADAYIFYDVQFGQTFLQIARGECARRLMVEWCQDADVLSIGSRLMTKSDLVIPFLFCPLICTAATARLLGLPSGALRPDRLWADCLRNGAVIVNGRTEGSPGPDRPHAGAAHEDCPAAAGAGPSD